jgi:uncharacterized protein (DUF1697 family)
VSSYVALLRGINVGGRAQVKMPALRAIFGRLGFDDVATYIQSGNVVFGSRSKPKTETIEKALSDALGLDIAVIVRSARDLRKVVDGNPFPHHADDVHVAFVAKPLTKATSDQVEPSKYPPEAVAIAKTELYFHLPNGMGRAKTPPYVARVLGVPMTVRNWRTVMTLRNMATELEEGV